ncbi:MAG: hypothetical protein ACE5JC_10905, partial [Candidatus Zixiibacteriota bacterium]
MSQGIDWGDLSGILALLIAALAFLRDLFGWELDFVPVHDSLRGNARRISYAVVFVLVSFSLWSMNNRTKSLKLAVTERDKEVATVYAAQADQAREIATLATWGKGIKSVQATQTAQAGTVVALESTRVAQATDIALARAAITWLESEAIVPNSSPTPSPTSGLPSRPSAPTLPRVTTPPPTQTSPEPTVTVQISGDYSVVQLRTKFDLEPTVEVYSIDTGSSLLNWVLARRRWGAGKEFVLRMADGVYMLIPLRMFQQADEVSKGEHEVTLVDGKKIRGRLDFTLKTPDDRPYDLRTAKKVVLTSLAESEPVTASSDQASTTVWQLHLLPQDLTYSVFNPRFFYQYDAPSGFPLGGYSSYDAESESFYL